MFRDTEAFAMPRLESASPSPSRFIDTPEYRRLVYRWMRREVRMPHRGGDLRRITAMDAWKRSGEYVAVLRGVETVLQPKGVAGLWSYREAV